MKLVSNPIKMETTNILRQLLLSRYYSVPITPIEQPIRQRKVDTKQFFQISVSDQFILIKC